MGYVWIYNWYSKTYRLLTLTENSASYYFDEKENSYKGLISVGNTHYYTKPIKDEIRCKKYCEQELRRLTGA